MAASPRPVWIALSPIHLFVPRYFPRSVMPLALPQLFLLVLSLVALSSATVKQRAENQLKLSADEQALLDLTNAERKKANLKPLLPNARLFAAARSHAANMAKQEKLEHELDGKGMAERIHGEGYVFSRAGENIAWNHKTPKEAITGWMNSEGHRMNILTPEFTQVGLGIAKSAKGELYWVQVFATPLEE
jgi:uncharacterized protein YkwD